MELSGKAIFLPCGRSSTQLMRDSLGAHTPSRENSKSLEVLSLTRSRLGFGGLRRGRRLDPWPRCGAIRSVRWGNRWWLPWCRGISHNGHSAGVAPAHRPLGSVGWRPGRLRTRCTHRRSQPPHSSHSILNLRSGGCRPTAGSGPSARLAGKTMIGCAPNMRMKLACRGGHICRKKSVLSVAAPPRSLCAIR